ncbi:hypothetical protein ACHAW6_015655 [Cyclotella cf. meneghiniana]
MASITAATTKKGGLRQSNIKFSGPWTEQEHEAFKQGVLGMGWSHWKDIQELYVPTRSKDQIKSHAQKFELHHPEQAKMLKRQVYTNDVMGKAHTTKVHAKFKIPKMSPIRLADIPQVGTDANLANARAILQKLSPHQLDVILAELSIAMPQCPPSSVAASPHPLMGAQVASDYFDELNIYRNPAARVSPTNEHEKSNVDFLGVIDSLDLFNDDFISNVAEQDMNRLHREEVQVGHHYYAICSHLNKPPDFNDPKECIVLDDYTRKVLSKGPLMRARLIEIMNSHINANWWKGDTSSVTVPISNGAKSQELIDKEGEAEHVVALLVAMYDLEEWRTLSSAGNVFELGDIFSVVCNANEMWTRIKTSLMRGGYTLFGGANGAHRVGLIQSVVDGLVKFYQEVESSCYLDVARF